MVELPVKCTRCQRTIMAFGFACAFCAGAHSALGSEVKLFTPPDLHAHDEQKAPQPKPRLVTITSTAPRRASARLPLSSRPRPDTIPTPSVEQVAANRHRRADFLLKSPVRGCDSPRMTGKKARTVQ